MTSDCCCLSLGVMVVFAVQLVGAAMNPFKMLQEFLANNDSDFEYAMSKLQQLGTKNSTDYDEKEWHSDKGKSVMRLPPWTKTDSRARDDPPVGKARPIAPAHHGHDYDMEESFERPVTMATSPDPWATGTIRSPATGEDGNTLAPTMPMEADFQGNPALDPTFKPFTRMAKTSKNFIKFTKSATGSEWARVSRNVKSTVATDNSHHHSDHSTTEEIPHWHIKTTTHHDYHPWHVDTTLINQTPLDSTSTTVAFDSTSSTQTTGRVEDTTLENSTSVHSDFEGQHTTSHHGNDTHHEEGHDEEHDEHHHDEESTSQSSPPAMDSTVGVARREVVEPNPAGNWPVPETISTTVLDSTTTVTTAMEKTVFTSISDVDFTRTRILGGESTAGTRGKRAPVTLEAFTEKIPFETASTAVPGVDLASTKYSTGSEATDGRWGARPLFTGEITWTPPATLRDEFIPRATTTEGDPKQFGGEFLPPDWSKTSRTSTSIKPTVPIVKEIVTPSKPRDGVDPWLMGVFRIRKTASPTTATAETTRFLFNKRFTTSTTVAAPTPAITEILVTTTSTERQTEETSTESQTRRKRDEFTGIPFGFFPFLRTTTLKPVFIATVLIEPLTRTTLNSKDTTKTTTLDSSFTTTTERQTEEMSPETTIRKRSDYTGVPFGFFPFVRSITLKPTIITTVLAETSTGPKDTKPPFGFFEIVKYTTSPRITATTSLPSSTITEPTLKMVDKITATTLFPIISSTTVPTLKSVVVEFKNISNSYNITSVAPQSTMLSSNGNSTMLLSNGSSTNVPKNVTQIPTVNITVGFNSTTSSPRILDNSSRLSTSSLAKNSTETTNLGVVTAMRNTTTTLMLQNATLSVQNNVTSQTLSFDKTATTDNDGPGGLNTTDATPEPPVKSQPRSSTADDNPPVQTEVNVTAVIEKPSIT